MEKKVGYKNDSDREKILSFCKNIATTSDKNEINLFINRYKENCKREFKTKFIKGFIISELIILIFFIIISLYIGNNFLIKNFSNIYQFFCIPIIAYGIVGIWYIFNKNIIISSLEKMVNDEERNIFVSDTFILEKDLREHISNTAESSIIESLVLKKENDIGGDTIIIGKSKSGLIWDEIKENKKYRFYAMSEKLILGIMNIE